MKINNMMQQSNVISSYMTNVTSSAARQAQAAQTPSTSGQDNVQLSQGAKEYAQLVKEAREAMETSETQESVRADEIMKSINKGTYSVSDTQVAASILNAGSMPLYG